MSFNQDYSSEIESLKAQLAEKDREISELKSRLNQNNSFSNSGSYSRAQAAFRSAVESLQENIASTDITGMNQLSSILNDDQNLETQITSLVSFLKNRLNAIPRLCAQLRGHVDFLTRLASSPKLQSLFLISDHTGSIFLPETARQLLLEQAARTSQLISEHPQILNDQYYKRTSTINTSLSIGNQSRNVDPNERLKNIQTLLSEDIKDPTELSSLLLQEILISSALQRLATDADDKLRQLSRCLNEGFQPNHNSTKSNRQGFGFEIEEEEEESNDEYGSIKKPNDDDFDFEKTLRLAKKISSIASKNQNQTNDDQNQLNSSLNNNNHNNNYSVGSNGSSKAQYYNRNENSNSMHNREFGYQNNDGVKNRNVENSSSVSEWQRWAKRLYHGLTQLNAESQNDIGLRMAIEEAALTSIGTQILQSRLKSLRIQKSVMKQPNVQTNQRDIGFSAPLICVISCIRIIKNTYSSNAYTTKRKVSQWSRKTVLNE